MKTGDGGHSDVDAHDDHKPFVEARRGLGRVPTLFLNPSLPDRNSCGTSAPSCCLAEFTAKVKTNTIGIAGSTGNKVRTKNCHGWVESIELQEFFGVRLGPSLTSTAITG